VVDNDKEGISAVLDWLSYVPKDKWSPPPIIETVRGLQAWTIQVLQSGL
jgi:acetyl-CoA carboxylase carboxyltransferase component